MFTYTPGGTRPLDKIRFLVQDTIEPPELQDEELELIFSTTDDTLTETRRISQAALMAAKALLARYTRELTISADGTSMQFGARAAAWAKIVNDLSISNEPWSQVVQLQRKQRAYFDYGETTSPFRSSEDPQR